MLEGPGTHQVGTRAQGAPSHKSDIADFGSIPYYGRNEPENWAQTSRKWTLIGHNSQWASWGSLSPWKSLLWGIGLRQGLKHHADHLAPTEDELSCFRLDTARQPVRERAPSGLDSVPETGKKGRYLETAVHDAA